MYSSSSSLRGLEGHVRSLGFQNQKRVWRHGEKKRSSAIISSVIVVEFRDEVYSSIAQLLKKYRVESYRAENTSELASKMVRHNIELILLSGTQPDESAWLTSAKLRIVDASRLIWLYSPQPPNQFDSWSSMAGIDEVIVYGGAIHTLIAALQRRLAPRVLQANRSSTDFPRRMSA